MAVYFGDDPLTYGQLLDRSRATANRLLDLGVGPGDTVGILMENCEEQITTLFAAAAVGAVEVSVNTAYRGRVPPSPAAQRRRGGRPRRRRAGRIGPGRER